ncbi:hypothetical protein PSN45_005086 [Yamadazyma tenuis]|uniref:Opaque-phase-specific protein OP4 n=1 Tax=Candida tenuis (strain ATCC 10573 / BCRC 21748 / CBS 615 / JCM 9827 / NBRC 10315 / NRRL Y-1498 / VKM Y-70) TaxID=590646 RepID=G3B2R4_CANTC|nr:uncharacterized protein CANTEDRAFT_113522 [Yamadazyma tenuis ATCC 10573]EGV64740.1 hypothetical protein CANTEDRAFT_113522 [Yamadazyma tenuis ATCC 10573]WEJ97532.1 hypothetical protein PSN45_005086 [Yamadazyma tenuis]
MRLFTFLFALILACGISVQAAPTTVDSGLSVREITMVQESVANINDYVKKRDGLAAEEKSKRESQIVTDVLTAIKDTNLAVPILEYVINDSTLEPIAVNTISYLIKNDYINIDTLLKALNDSGLAVSVIQDLISDCNFYAEIYSLALGYISDLADKIGDYIKGLFRREYMMVEITPKMAPLQRRASEEEILTSLMESLKDSGLANQVVEALVVDPAFYSFGADLIKKLIEDNDISLSSLVADLLDSGLIPSLIKAFLNLGTFDTIITNALAAAFGKCDGSSVTSAITSATTVASITTTPISDIPLPTGSTGVCRKKKRSYVH